MITKLTLLALTALLCVSMCWAQGSVKDGKSITTWTLVGEGPGEWTDQKYVTHQLDAPTKTYYAPETIARAGDIVKVWVKWDYPRGMGTLVQELGLPQDYGSLRVYMVLNCKRAEMGAITMLLYDRSGRFALSGTTDTTPKEIPDTMGSELLQYFCERTDGRPTQSPTLKKEMP